MGAHLRNGKNISFEQQAAAAAREQQRAEQLRTRLPDAQLDAERASGPDANSSSTAETSRSQVASQANLPTADHQTHPPQPPVKEAAQNYPENPSLRPAALERLRRTREQPAPVDGIRRADQLEPTSLEEHLFDPHRGVAPSEINSRATSIALASARSTPVPAPVDRQEF
ncbi:hypothetical protein PCANC_28085 [Puccinia coronata f. sp. avenae]|uniref:Uncharacterized protein n=1 Tax=Puccinia coronata f. sp. avenae TaxID=200324 RepID=A0A2N5S2E7_9BASI|nr:hypothetical protein PCANC_28085 [Puccinia coronata f. sp. avenae]